jgi:superoxide dismutase, Fe-Mn family
MTGPFKLSPLPYAEDALEPVISANTISFHYNKHHATYVKTLNELVAGTDYADMKLEEIVRETAGKDSEKEKKIFNNAGQVWNHDFYWRSLSAKPAMPRADLKVAIEEFGGADKLISDLADAGKAQFGSGWAWLVSKNGKLAVEKTPNAVDPMSKGVNALLTIDVWEHAYYLDYQNRRVDYVNALIEKLANWEFAAENLSR